MKRLLTSIATLATGALLLAAPAGIAFADTAVYNAIPSTLPPNVASVGFQANQTAQFGDYVHLAGTARILHTVTVTMSDWALYSTYASDTRYSGNQSSWTHPITINIYSNHLGANGVPDTLLATKTENVTIPWRPAEDPTNCPTKDSPGYAYKWQSTPGAPDTNCNNGFAFNVAFDLSSLNVTLPSDIIIGVAYNTNTWGASPIGVGGPYESLNVGVNTSQAVSVGTDDSADKVFWNTQTAADYTDGGAAGVGIFRQDTGWTPNGTVNLKITANTPAPAVTTDPATGISTSDATLNGTDGPLAASQESFWVSTTSPIDTSSANIPAGVYSTPVLPGVAAGASFSDPLSLVTTSGITTGGVPANMPAITPNTTYYYVAWANIGGTWHPGGQLSVTTSSAANMTVTIDKFIDGRMATAASANNSAFPMSATWNATNIGAGSGAYALSSTGFNSANPYEAVTAQMTPGASYSTNEVTTGSVVGASCAAGHPYALVGYSTGTSKAAAASSTPSATVPSFTNITQNEYVIVWNKDCLAAPTLLTPPNGTSTTTAGLTGASWSAVSDPAGGITYVFQSSNASAQNPDGSFASPAYTSGHLSATNIPTPGTPAGSYWWHVQATDADGNVSPWSSVWTFTVNNTPPSPLPPLSCTLTADKTTITRGQAVTLTWTSSNATTRSLTLDRGSILVPAAGSIVVHPAGTRPYLLSLTEIIPHVGGTFKQCSVMVTVN